MRQSSGDRPPAGQTEIRLGTGPVLVGRDVDCGVHLDDPSVSRRHAAFEPTAGGWRVRDLESRNGVTVNGRRVREAAVRPGDVVAIGSVQCTLRDAARPDGRRRVHPAWAAAALAATALAAWPLLRGPGLPGPDPAPVPAACSLEGVTRHLRSADFAGAAAEAARLPGPTAAAVRGWVESGAARSPGRPQAVHELVHLSTLASAPDAPPALAALAGERRRIIERERDAAVAAAVVESLAADGRLEEALAAARVLDDFAGTTAAALTLRHRATYAARLVARYRALAEDNRGAQDWDGAARCWRAALAWADATTRPGLADGLAESEREREAGAALAAARAAAAADDGEDAFAWLARIPDATTAAAPAEALRRTLVRRRDVRAAAVHYAAGEATAARNRLQPHAGTAEADALRARVDRLDTLLQQAEVHVTALRVAEARDTWLEACAAEPDAANAFRSRAAARLAEWTPARGAEVLRARGVTAIGARRYAEARDLWERAQRLAPPVGAREIRDHLTTAEVRYNEALNDERTDPGRAVDGYREVMEMLRSGDAKYAAALARLERLRAGLVGSDRTHGQ